MKSNTRTKPGKSVSPKRVAHQVRIIGGQWKRSLLTVVEAEGLRPTPDRVRETAFNWLNHLVDGDWQRLSCLDLFAGSGSLGFEAASRGAKQVMMVESHTPAFKQLEQVRDKLHATQVHLVRGDASRVTESLVAQQQRFDVIFLDPPFHQDWLTRLLPVCERLLVDGGLIYVEAEHALPELATDVNEAAFLAGWQVIRADKAGSVFFHILQRNILQHSPHENQA